MEETRWVMDCFHITIVFCNIISIMAFDFNSSVEVYLRFSKAVYASTGCVHKKQLTPHL